MASLPGRISKGRRRDGDPAAGVRRRGELILVRIHESGVRRAAPDAAGPQISRMRKGRFVRMPRMGKRRKRGADPIESRFA